MTNKNLIFFLLFSLFFFLSSFVLFAAGKADEEEQKLINNEWLLCVTQFDYSKLPQSQRISGQVITRSLVDTLKAVSYRLRISSEYAYYEGYAWWQAVNAAAKTLAQKQEERSLLLFRGDPDWRYQINVKKLDTDIEKLKEDLAKKQAERPIVNKEPSFNLIQANIDGTFPDPPKPGGERRFCQNQKADAFLLGGIQEFHGRFFITLKLYLLYANAYVYEDDVIFSMDDLGGAIDEITGRLTAVLSGNKPAVIAVNANPPEAQVLINQSFAGRGVVEAREHPPGKLTIAVAAEGYTPELEETELVSGEITEIQVTLSPLLYSNVRINVPGAIGGATGGAYGVSVYQGALYVGEAPYNLRMPIDTLGYVTAETKSGRAAKIVFSSPDMPDESYDFSLKLKQTTTGQKKVNKARGEYYWAWGATWITAMLAWGANGIYTGRADVASRATHEFRSETQTWEYISTGSVILVGAVGAFTIYELVRYLRISTDDATPIAKRENK